MNNMAYQRLTTISVPYSKQNSEPLTFRLDEIPHLLISGTTGSGKTSYVRSAIANLLQQYSYENLQFIICDSKQVDYLEFNITAAMLVPVVTDSTKVPAVLQWLHSETTDRLKHGNHLSDNPNIICIIDDFGAFRNGKRK